MAFLKAGYDNKVWGKENILFNQVPCLVRQWSHNFLSFMFVSHVLIEAFLVLEISGLIQFHWALAWSLDSQCFCILPTYWSLLPPSKCLSIARISLLIHRVLAFLLSFLFFGMDCFWAWQRWALNIKWLSWVSHPSKTLPHSILPNRSLKRQFLCWSPGFWTQFSSPPSGFWTSPSHGLCHQDCPWPSHPNKPLHVGMKSSRSLVLVDSSISQRRKLPTTHSRCLDWLCLAVLSLQAMLGVVEAPHKDQGLRAWGCFHLFVQGLIDLLFLVRWQAPTKTSPLPVLS